MSAHKHGICSMTTIVRCPRTGRACSEGACRERHWCRQLFERVQSLILADWGYDCPVTVQKIVAMSREGGAYAYPIDGGQIGAMAKEGFLRRDGNLVWVDRTCRTG